MRIWIALILWTVFCGVALTSHLAGSAPRARMDKSHCTSQELAKKDCRLTAGPYTVRLLAASVVWNDGIWHTVDPFPNFEDILDWEKVQFLMLGKAPVLQVWVWDKGVGEAHVQSLHWWVADADKRKLTVLSSSVVRKRRPLVVAGENAPAEKRPVRYLTDAMEPHSLKALSNGRWEWRLRDQKKVLTPTTSNESVPSHAPQKGH